MLQSLHGEDNLLPFRTQLPLVLNEDTSTQTERVSIENLRFGQSYTRSKLTFNTAAEERACPGEANTPRSAATRFDSTLRSDFSMRGARVIAISSSAKAQRINQPRKPNSSSRKEISTGQRALPS